jgi:pimeloyl-ACP methyl ester carboxylesterase
MSASISLKVERLSVNVRGYPVRYKRVGHGAPVILVHGLSGSTLWWARTIPALAAHYTLYLVDLPGFGSMRRSRQSFLLSEAAAWLYDWMQALAIPRATFIAHSMGGCICIRLAARYPDAVERLVLVAPAGVPSERTLVGYFLPLLIALRYTTFRFLPILFYDAMRAGIPTLLRAIQDLLTQDIRADLPAVCAPTLLIWGEHDSLVPPTFAEILRSAIPGARLLLVKGKSAGHIVMFDRPRECNSAMLAFLSGKSVGK